MPNIFLSYRRSDSGQYIGRIVDRLEAAGFTVFYDLDKINAGEKWRDAIRTSVTSSDVLVAVIGKAWLSERLHEENDPVLTEIALALDLDKPVIPLLLDRCPLPAAQDMPPCLERMRQYNAARLDTSDPDFSDHIKRLVASLKSLTHVEADDSTVNEFGQPEVNSSQQAAQKFISHLLNLKNILLGVVDAEAAIVESRLNGQAEIPHQEALMNIACKFSDCMAATGAFLRLYHPLLPNGPWKSSFASAYNAIVQAKQHEDSSERNEAVKNSVNHFMKEIDFTIDFMRSSSY